MPTAKTKKESKEDQEAMQLRQPRLFFSDFAYERVKSGSTNGNIYSLSAGIGLDREKCNVNGGAIGLGHPLGATGTRLVLTLMYQLRRSAKRFGVASACIGGGQGIAILIENTKA